MQRFLNVLRMHRVHKAIEAATFQVEYADFARYEYNLDTMRCVDPTGQVWVIVDYDGALVYLRKATGNLDMSTADFINTVREMM